MFFVIGATEGKGHVILAEGPGPHSPNPETATSCWDYDRLRRPDKAAEKWADEGDPSGVFLRVSTDAAMLAYATGLAHESMGSDACDPGSGFATLPDAWKWIREHQSCDCNR